jgi:large subunit ribosomal protein L25
MREILLQGDVRTPAQMGKRSKAIRRDGKVPGVYYVHGEPNIPVTVLEKSLKPLIFTSETHVIHLKLADGAEKNCILRDIQFDPITDRPVHFDLQGLLDDEEITIEVPIVVSGGTPIGVRDGGILQQIIRRLKISCLPKHIPDHIEVNVGGLNINDFVHVRDLTIPNITILETADNTILGVMPPTVEKEETVAAATTEAAEPEVITKGKKPEDGAEAEGGEKKAEAAPAKDEKKK